MNNKDNMGALNKRAKKDSTNKQVIILLVVILLVILGIFLVLKSVGNTEKKVDSANIETIMKNGETKLIFVIFKFLN